MTHAAAPGEAGISQQAAAYISLVHCIALLSLLVICAASVVTPALLRSRPGIPPLQACFSPFAPMPLFCKIIFFPQTFWIAAPCHAHSTVPWVHLCSVRSLHTPPAPIAFPSGTAGGFSGHACPSRCIDFALSDTRKCDWQISTPTWKHPGQLSSCFLKSFSSSGRPKLGALLCFVRLKNKNWFDFLTGCSEDFKLGGEKIHIQRCCARVPSLLFRQQQPIFFCLAIFSWLSLPTIVTTGGNLLPGPALSVHQRTIT